jgi:tRNA threonylcarbamoyladenosine biosynthesis protein TsaB
MRVLAFDCSTADGSVAVVEDGAAIFHERFACPRGRGGEFFLSLDRAVRVARGIDRIVVGVGPGSYNGVRTAISAGEGLRLATGAELVGVPSVCALSSEDGEYLAVSDARGGVFYYVRIRGRQVDGEFQLLDADALAVRLDAEPSLAVFTSAEIPSVPRAIVGFPDAVILGRLGATAPPAAAGLEPLYLKPAHITTPRKNPVIPERGSV